MIPTSPLIPHHYIPNPHHTNGNNSYCLLPAVASTTSESLLPAVTSTLESTAHNKYNHKLTKEITNQSPRAINKTIKKFRSLLALQGSGKNLCGQKPCGIKRPQRKKPKLKSATYSATNIHTEKSVQAK